MYHNFTGMWLSYVWIYIHFGLYTNRQNSDNWSGKISFICSCCWPLYIFVQYVWYLRIYVPSLNPWGVAKCRDVLYVHTKDVVPASQRPGVGGGVLYFSTAWGKDELDWPFIAKGPGSIPEDVELFRNSKIEWYGGRLCIWPSHARPHLDSNSEIHS